MNSIDFKNGKYKPERSEILRYMGYSGQKTDENIDGLIDRCIDEMIDIVRPRYTYSVFDIKIDTDKSGGPCISLIGANLKLTGNDIYEHLRECRKCAVMAVTLGIAADNAIRVAQSSDMTKAVIYDACATELVEKACDFVEDEIKELAESEGRGTNFRFSPGYGDLPIEVQPTLINTLDAGRKAGITVTPSMLMTPSKSVTAVIGFTTLLYKNKKKRSKCDICSMRGNCAFRKRGTTCGRV